MRTATIKMLEESCRVYGFTTGLRHSGNVFIWIWAQTPASSPLLTASHTWERSLSMTPTRTWTCMTRVTCDTAFSADTSTPGRSTRRSSASALVWWVYWLLGLCSGSDCFPPISATSCVSTRDQQLWSSVVDWCHWGGEWDICVDAACVLKSSSRVKTVINTAQKCKN